MSSFVYVKLALSIQINQVQTIIKLTTLLMTEPIYLQDPNQYIRNLSQVRRSIQKRISPSLNSSISHHSLSTELHRQISTHLDKYQKTILTNKRIKATRSQQEKEDQRRKEQMKEIIRQKIQASQEVREHRRKKLVEGKQVERLVKMVGNQQKKELIRRENVIKALGIIQRLQNKMGREESDDEKGTQRLPIKLRMLEEHVKSSQVLAKSRHLTSLSPKERSISFSSSLPRIIKPQKSQQQPSPTLLLTQLHQTSHPSGQDLIKQLQASQSTLKNRSKSLLNLDKLKLAPNPSNSEQQILQKLIEQNNDDRINRYLLKNTIGYKASSSSSAAKLVRNAIQGYLLAGKV